MAVLYKPSNICIGGKNHIAQMGSSIVPSPVSEVEVTTFASGGHKEFAAGLKETSWDLAGFDEPEYFKNLDTLDPSGNPYVVQIEASSGIDFYCGEMIDFKVSFGGSVGEANSLTLTLKQSGRIRRLADHHNALNSDVVATGISVPVEFPLSSGELFAAINVTSLTGTDIVFDMQTDTAVGFPVPTSHGTLVFNKPDGKEFAAITTPDTFARVEWTGTFTAARFRISLSIL